MLGVIGMIRVDRMIRAMRMLFVPIRMMVAMMVVPVLAMLMLVAVVPAAVMNKSGRRGVDLGRRRRRGCGRRRGRSRRGRGFGRCWICHFLSLLNN